MLLDQDEVNPDKPDNDGRTPLLHAAWSGHTEVVKMLLDQDEVNPDKPDNDGQTPLLCATWNSQEEVIVMLLRRRYNNGRAPLCILC